MKNVKSNMLFLLIFLKSVFAYSVGDSIEVDLRKEVDEYIKKVEVYENEFTKQFVVYILYESYDEQLNKRCYSIGQIMNSFEFKHYYSGKYFKSGNDFVIVVSDLPLGDNLENITLNDLDKYSKIKIAQKLYPEVIGAFSYTSFGYLYCIGSDGAVEKTFFNQAESIPLKHSFYKFIDLDYTIEKRK
jgi:hypothetical protein